MSDGENVEPSAAQRMERFVAEFKAEGESQDIAGKYGPGAARPAAPPEDEHGFPLPPTWPYPGLRAFTPREARLFFGRQREAGDLRKRLADSNIVAVLGGSGSGKSSLVLAGVLPRLNDVGRIMGRRGRWYAVTFRPGDAPCRRLIEAVWNDACLPLLALKEGPRAFGEVLGDNIAETQVEAANGFAALRARFEAIVQPRNEFSVAGLIEFLDKLDDIDRRLAELRETPRAGKINFLLVIDQFEELFRETVKKEQPEDIRRMVELLTYACGHREDPLVVVITLRSEELHRCSEIEGLAPVINASFYLIDRPSVDALDMATVSPGRQTLQYWRVALNDDETATEEVEKSAPFSPAFIHALTSWVQDFQKEDFSAPVVAERRKRHQSDLLPLFQHLLRVSWSAAVERWAREQPEKATVEVSDIENWIEERRGRVDELRAWMRANQKGSIAYTPPQLSNMLERCFDIGFAITLSEAVTGKPWAESKSWPSDAPSMVERLRLIEAAFVALATRDDKGNDARRPASAAEVVEASHQTVSEDTVRNTLSFFKARNYLQGGDTGERYDVSHEALIRNSTEYQTWLADAKNVSNSLARANAALMAAASEPVRRDARKEQWSFAKNIWRAVRKVWGVISLTDLREAGSRFSENTCRDLERVFATDATFSPSWMAERAELGKSATEREDAVLRLERAWTRAYRWHIDLGAARQEGEKAYTGIDLVRAFQRFAGRGHSRNLVTGRQLRALRVFTLVYVVSGIIVLAPLGSSWWYSKFVLPVIVRTTAALNYAKTSDTNDFRLRLLLLAAALRESDTEALAQATREALLRAPVFAGDFAAGAWDAAGERVVTLDRKSRELVVHDVSDGREVARANFPGEDAEADVTPPSVGFFNNELAAFQIISASVLVGQQGPTLKERFQLPAGLQGLDEWIPRADIFGDHMRAIFLHFANNAIDGMSVLELSEGLNRQIKPDDKKRVSWNPIAQTAFRQPFLAEDCNDYAYLGRLAPVEGKEAYALWVGHLGADEAKSVQLSGRLGMAAIARGCRYAVVRDEGAYGSNFGQFHVISLQDGVPAPSKSVPFATLTPDGPKLPGALSDQVTLFLFPSNPQSQPIFAAAPRPDNGVWRTGWLTEQGLAVVDIRPDDSAQAVTLVGDSQMLTGLDARYESGSLSFSRDGSSALLMRQRTFSSPVQLRLYRLDLRKRRDELERDLKSTDDLVRKACQIAKMDGGNQLTNTERLTWFGQEDAPQPCPPDGR
jgi:hypothetical protein